VSLVIGKYMLQHECGYFVQIPAGAGVLCACIQLCMCGSLLNYRRFRKLLFKVGKHFLGGFSDGGKKSKTCLVKEFFDILSRF
jgi:hypothetical protein